VESGGTIVSKRIKKVRDNIVIVPFAAAGGILL
jgi:hypothetical protein